MSNTESSVVNDLVELSQKQAIDEKPRTAPPPIPAGAAIVSLPAIGPVTAPHTAQVPIVVQSNRAYYALGAIALLAVGVLFLVWWTRDAGNTPAPVAAAAPSAQVNASPSPGNQGKPQPVITTDGEDETKAGDRNPEVATALADTEPTDVEPVGDEPAVETTPTGTGDGSADSPAVTSDGEAVGKDEPVAAVAETAKPKPTKAVARSRTKSRTSSKRDLSSRRKAGSSSSKAKYGILMVSAKPPCKIYIDGKPTGLRTPQRNIRLKAGKHRIVLVNREHGIKSASTVSIRAGKKRTLVKNLTKRMR